jgi:Bacterial PH domain
MKEQFKKFLNEEQDPKAIEKISAKLNDILMKNEEVGYIGVQKKPAINVFPDSIVLTNRRIIICKPKNLGLSMDFTDYAWSNIAGVFVKENILGSEFSFNTHSDITISIDYLPKIQARKINTFAKEQLEELKHKHSAEVQPQEEELPSDPPGHIKDIDINREIEEIEAEEVEDFSSIINSAFKTQNPEYTEHTREVDPLPAIPEGDDKLVAKEKAGLESLNKEQLFEKLQNYKKLLDNGLILQGEYDALKKEILAHL